MSRVEEVEAELHSNQLHEFADNLARTLAAEVDARDEVITRLLDLLLPGVAPPHAPCGCVECERHEINEGRYARACEIAGRTE